MTKFFLIFLFTLNFCFPQSDSTSINTEAENEFLDNLSGETEDSELLDMLEYLKRNPVNINSASSIELQSIPFIDFNTAKQIINHRDNYGYYFSISELYSIKDIPDENIKVIIPFLIVDSVSNFQEEISERSFIKNIRVKNRSRFLSDLQERKGFADEKYMGSKYKTYNRFMASNENLQLSFLVEKDPGEKSYNDFTSFSLTAKKLWFFDKISAGDYLFEFGQGLVLWSPYGFSKGAEAIYSAKKKSRGIIPYTSSDENNFFRGGAASLNISNILVSFFYSQNRFDARIDESGKIISTPVDGYHRTESEFLRRKTSSEKIFGAAAEYKRDNLTIGVLHFGSRFDKDFLQQSVFGRNKNSYSYTSAAYDWVIKSINIFGEAAYDGKSVASITSVQLILDKNIQLINSIRNYPRNFISLHGFGFAERSGNVNNEFGIYFGIKWRNFLGTFNTYFDQFKFPFSTSASYLPLKGKEFMADFLSKKISGLKLGLRYKYQKKEYLISEIKQSARGEISIEVNKKLRIKSRLEVNELKTNTTENGFLVFTDARFDALEEITIYSRIIFFKTDSFNSAVYEFENDLYGIFTNLPMYGDGMRWYFILKYSPVKSINLSAKYSETYKPKEKSLGSGDSEINNNLDNRLSIQLDFSF